MIYGRRTTQGTRRRRRSTRPVEPGHLEAMVRESHVAATAARRRVRRAAVRRIRGRAMRWVRYEAGAGPRIGRLDPGVVAPVAADRIEDVIAGRGTTPDGSKLPVTNVRLLAPVTPGKVIAVGQNYLDHI